MVRGELQHLDCIDGFLDELRRELCPEAVAVEKEKLKLTIRELSKNVLAFGQHNGKRFDEVPRDYLHWLAEQQEASATLIHAYLAATSGEDEDEAQG